MIKDKIQIGKDPITQIFSKGSGLMIKDSVAGKWWRWPALFPHQSHIQRHSIEEDMVMFSPL
jgi:hypothetical protein